MFREKQTGADWYARGPVYGSEGADRRTDATVEVAVCRLQHTQNVMRRNEKPAGRDLITASAATKPF